ncbi:hypothetical protein NDU88_002515 [Pleurodeles waltl]|uniref:Uncharacterized protein n=1 Tax=Pleurodeles waltl TaxID=8319 RepID=A0AAV7KSW6_PLEWA|nr:hypothetical protein NDU88_002515 [Pleurodeles waltl]
MSEGVCSWLSANAALDSSDWRCLCASEESVGRSHGSQGADPCAMNPDFRVPGSVKVDNGLRDGEEENIEDAAEDAKKGEEKTDAGGTRREGRAGNSDVPTERMGPVRKDSSEETHTYRHVPGGAWLNKVRSLFKGQSKETRKSWDGGEEGRDVEEGLRGEQLGGLERGVAGREREGPGRTGKTDTTTKLSL